MNRYLSFCRVFNVSVPFQVSESILCYFVVSLAEQGLAPATINTYLAAVRHAQIIRGLPEVRQGQLPRLQLVQTGVKRERALRGGPQRQRLLITPDMLRQLHDCWVAPPTGADQVMLWAAASSCFFWFLPSRGDYHPVGGGLRSQGASRMG